MVLSLDHLVLTCTDLAATRAWYERVLGMHGREHNGRWALHFPSAAEAGHPHPTQKINLHQRGREIEPHALTPTPGAADLCFRTEQDDAWWIEHLLVEGVVIVEGPVRREGAQGSIESIYVRDPDGNLVEVARYLPSSASSD